MAALIVITLLSGSPMSTTHTDQAALSAIVVARGVAGDAPVEPGEVFAATVGDIVVAFRYQGLADGTEIIRLAGREVRRVVRVLSWRDEYWRSRASPRGDRV